MIRIEKEAWQTMLQHAKATYPRECCGALLGTADARGRHVVIARPMRNAYDGPQQDSYQLDPTEQLAVEKEARALGLSVVGIFHSHPDCDAYFSKRDLENSCPWYSFVVLSIKAGEFDHAKSFLPNFDQTAAEQEPLEYMV
ncbi:MAG: M67 family metallopeptidase [Bryobacteraceae bacterium]|nr:M67 family metallopeptidase [Bryobacteraceae bacterium]MDW8378112.1 M67 family metallopeptidase [Bryobacterales bacterium]